MAGPLETGELEGTHPASRVARRDSCLNVIASTAQLLMVRAFGRLLRK